MYIMNCMRNSTVDLKRERKNRMVAVPNPNSPQINFLNYQGTLNNRNEDGAINGLLLPTLYDLFLFIFGFFHCFFFVFLFSFWRAFRFFSGRFSIYKRVSKLISSDGYLSEWLRHVKQQDRCRETEKRAEVEMEESERDCGFISLATVTRCDVVETGFSVFLANQ